MIERGHKYELAEKLLNMVINDNRSSEIDGYVGMFENCREQGYRILWWSHDNVGETHTIAFSENRNSDDIVVYHSEDYEEYAFGYSDKFWDSAKYFRYDDYEGAVDYIYSIMLE